MSLKLVKTLHRAGPGNHSLRVRLSECHLSHYSHLVHSQHDDFDQRSCDIQQAVQKQVIETTKLQMSCHRKLTVKCD